MKSCSWRDQTWPHPSLADRTQRSDRGGEGGELSAITETAPPLAGPASPDLDQSGEGWENYYCKTATRDNQIKLQPCPAHLASSYRGTSLSPENISRADTLVRGSLILKSNEYLL